MSDLQKLLAEATPRPWQAEGMTIHLGVTRWPDDDAPWYDSEGRIYDEGGHTEADAALIVAAVNALPALLDVAEAARKVRKADGIDSFTPQADVALMDLDEALARLDGVS